MSFVVTLTDLELLSCRMFGNMRTIFNRVASVKDKQMGTQAIYKTDEDGAIGEYAFCKHFNIMFDISMQPRSGSYDCIYKGKKIDIKTTRVAHGKLIATTKKNPDVDVFVLAIINSNQVTFPGYALSSEMYDDANLSDLGHGKSYVINQKNLRQWKAETKL